MFCFFTVLYCTVLYCTGLYCVHLTLFLPAMSTTTSLLPSLLMFLRLLMTAGGMLLPESSLGREWNLVVNSSPPASPLSPLSRPLAGK